MSLLMYLCIYMYVCICPSKLQLDTMCVRDRECMDEVIFGGGGESLKKKWQKYVD